YLEDQIAAKLAKKGYAVAFPHAPSFGEVCVRVPGGDAGRLVERSLGKNIIPGVALGRFTKSDQELLLVGVSELHGREEIDRLISVLQEVA
ncbi:MAG: hypothetical protein V2A73_01800, partial [Pseudomonadota bacterium]